jgi:outer membrane protein TolC
MTMKRFGAAEWLSGDRRDARRAAAERRSARKSGRIAAADARLQTALAYIDAFYVGEALQLTTLMEHHAHEQLETARARVASASGSSEEVLRLGAARGMAEDESAELRQQQSAARVALQRWTERAPRRVRPTGFLVPSEDDYVNADPTVAALQRDVESAHRGGGNVVEPPSNWTWEVAYEQRTGYSDMISFGVSIRCRLRRRRGRIADHVEARLGRQGEADLTYAMRAARGGCLALVGDVQRLQERIERVRSSVLIPAQQRTAAATAAYRSNQASLTTLFDARHGEVDVQRKLLGVRRELAKRQAQLAYRPIPTGGTP